ncbi:MAG: replication factor C small subunit [Candidatus Aenigmatarchaeota archaeon]|nr:replication factor C small subunit [Candidatus Aenigmarchaeota archaeon]
MQIENYVWAEKYRPKKLDEVINQKHIIEKLKFFVKEKNIPHMLFAGPAGCGKTTCALAIAEELYGKTVKFNVMETNASDERGIDTVRVKIKEFARTKPMGNIPFKLIILDEADALTFDAQSALRRTMEQFSSICRFILICNYSSKIIEPIQSRTVIFRFKTLSEEDIKNYILRIVKSENLKIDESGISAIIKLSEGDMRKVANLLQAASIEKNNITADVVYSIASQAKPDDVKDMLNLVFEGKFNEAREKLKFIMNHQGVSGQDIIKEIHRQIIEMKIPERKKIEIIQKIGEYEFRISEGANEIIQLEALLAQLLVLGE